MPRLVYFTGLALILVAGAFLLTRELTWQPGVTAGNVARIRKGLTREEVGGGGGADGRDGRPSRIVVGRTGSRMGWPTRVGDRFLSRDRD
jgi:hypothetical protein